MNNFFTLNRIFIKNHYDLGDVVFIKVLYITLLEKEKTFLKPYYEKLISYHSPNTFIYHHIQTLMGFKSP